MHDGKGNYKTRSMDAAYDSADEVQRVFREFGPMGASEQHPIVLDSGKRYSDDPSWIYELDLDCSEYMAGGFGDLENAPGLREVFDAVEGLYTDVADGDEVKVPEELMRRYVEQRLGGAGKVVWR